MLSPRGPRVTGLQEGIHYPMEMPPFISSVFFFFFFFGHFLLKIDLEKLPPYIS